MNYCLSIFNEGTTGGIVYIYDVKDKVNFIKEFQCYNSQIDCLLVKRGNLFVGCKLEVSIWNLIQQADFKMTKTAAFIITEEKKKDFEFHNLTCIQYYAQEKIFISAYENGIILFWNATSGDIIGAYNNQYGVTKLQINEERDILLVGFESGDIKIFKFGQLPNELKQN